jgi:NNP family nitrate/nitrite transporter-like MFS transporter
MTSSKATKIELANFHTPQMRAFHSTWAAFLLCFFGWFGIAPLMGIVREDLGLTKAQVGSTIIASVAITILARLAIGPLCDRIGPRRMYSALLVFGALPVMGIGLSHGFLSLLLFRLAIGVVGSSFVLTQFHTSQMFAPNVVGTANAMTAGWGNLGGGIAQLAMPLIFAAFVASGFTTSQSWRLAMLVPGALMIAAGIAYYFLTQDTPDGDLRDVRRQSSFPAASSGKGTSGSFLETCKDGRVWALAGMYGACFGVELTMNNVASLYFRDHFHVSVTLAGALASLHGMMNLFARALGGWFGDRTGRRFGLRGRAALLGMLLGAEGLALAAFSRLDVLPVAVAMFVLFSLFVEMGAGATYAVVPFVNPRAVGSVSGIVGAGGNVGAVLGGLLFRAEHVAYQTAFLWLGVAVAGTALLSLLVRFTEAEERTLSEELAELDAPAHLLPAE